MQKFAGVFLNIEKTPTVMSVEVYQKLNETISTLKTRHASSQPYAEQDDIAFC